MSDTDPEEEWELEQRTPVQFGGNFSLNPTLARTPSCPIMLESPSGLGTRLAFCEIGRRLREGARLEHAIADVVAELQWTHPSGPWTALQAREILLASCCGVHRQKVAAFFDEPRVAS